MTTIGQQLQLNICIQYVYTIYKYCTYTNDDTRTKYTLTPDDLLCCTSQLPVSILLIQGPEESHASVPTSLPKEGTAAPTVELCASPEQPLLCQDQGDSPPLVAQVPVRASSLTAGGGAATGLVEDSKDLSRRPAVRYICLVAVLMGGLLLLSDISLSDFPQERCFPAAATALQSSWDRYSGTKSTAYGHKTPGPTGSNQQTRSDGTCHTSASDNSTPPAQISNPRDCSCPEVNNMRACNKGDDNRHPFRVQDSDHTAAAQGHFCWLTAAYRSQILIDDVTPNIGQWWYFFMEMFDAYKPFFRFVAHSSTAIMAVPLAVRFPRRPVFLFVVQTLVTALFRPYPSVADLGLGLSLLALMRPQLASCGAVLFMSVTFALLGVLGPAMLHQWLAVESANSNFYYSITLLGGAWQVALVVQLLLLTVSLEQRGGVVGQTGVGVVTEPGGEQVVPEGGIQT